MRLERGRSGRSLPTIGKVWLGQFCGAVRRTQSDVEIGPHLQQLPGGLDVLTGSVGPDGPEAVKSIASLLASAESSPGGPWDLLVDLGRLIAGDGRARRV